MTAQLMPVPVQSFVDNSGNMLAGGLLYSYEAGTTTPQATYTDATGTTPNTNPVIIDSAGRASIWLSSSAYKIVLEDAIGNIIWTKDNISTINPNSITESMMAPLSIGTPELIAQSVTTAKIQPLAVTAACIDNQTITAAQIANQTITATQIANATVTGTQIAPDTVTLANMADSFFNDTSLGRNRIINGLFNVQQRGTAGSVSSGNYVADRWVYTKNGTMVNAVAVNSSNVPPFSQAGRFFLWALGATCTTAEASIGSTDFVMISQRIEGSVFSALAQRPMILSFWVYASKPGVYCVSLRDGGHANAYVAEYTVTTTNTWQKINLPILAPPSAMSPTAFTATSTCLDVGFVLAAGSSFQTTAGTWNSGNFLSTSNQVNAVDSTSDYFSISAVQLETGSIASDFDERLYGDELSLCKRYYDFANIACYGYNANVVAAKAIGTTIVWGVNKRTNTPTNTFFTTPTFTNCSNAVFDGVSSNATNVAADFAATGAGPAKFTAVVLCDAEL